MRNLTAMKNDSPTSSVSRVDRAPWAGAAVLLIATLSVMFGRGYLAPDSGAVVPFELLATDVGGQMRIHWNGLADDVSQAEHAVLEVGDGNKQDRFSVSRSVLASGTIEYTRKSDDVAATLVLFKDGRETERRTVRSVSAPSAP